MSPNPELRRNHDAEEQAQSAVHRARQVAGNLLSRIDPTVDGVHVPSGEMPTAYAGFADTPRGRAAREYTVERLQEAEERRQQDA